MSQHAVLIETASPRRDREVIRVDFTCDKLGIAAALRRAFVAAADDPCDRDFDLLLSELN